MASENVRSDKGIGFAVFFSLLAGVGAVGMLAAPSQLATAWAFAAAMVAASLAVVLAQAYW